MLAHELAHLQRGDCAWLLLVRVACAVGWVQPLWWALARSLEASSEEACDQEALRGEASPHAYARCLVELAERLLRGRVEQAAGAGIAPCRSSLERRVRSQQRFGTNRALEQRNTSGSSRGDVQESGQS